MTEEPPRPSLGTAPRPSPGTAPRPSPGSVPRSGPAPQASPAEAALPRPSAEQHPGSPRPGVPAPPVGDPPRAVPGPVPDATGRTLDTLDAALRPLDTLAGRPVDEHPAVFDAVHESLRRTLTESDS